MPWDPSLYLAFASERLRPAVDLISRIRLERARSVVDLGCGAGNVTRLLAERWPEAELTGVDSSPEMLARAAAIVPDARLVNADIAAWSPPASFDVVFSNAALHWLPDHRALFPRLAGWVSPGGYLAVQMPASFALPSHTAAYEAAEEGPWSERLRAVARAGVRELEDYFAYLSPRARAVDLWETTYLHVLEGDDPVTEWFKSTLLMPLLDALPEPEREPFLDAYRRRVRAAYPRQPSGQTLMRLRRLFVVAEL